MRWVLPPPATPYESILGITFRAINSDNIDIIMIQLLMSVGSIKKDIRSHRYYHTFGNSENGNNSFGASGHKKQLGIFRLRLAFLRSTGNAWMLLRSCQDMSCFRGQGRRELMPPRDV